MSMPQAVRHINAIRALKALFRNGPMSRADLARELRLTRATASSIVAGQVRAGYSTSDEARAGEHGKRSGRPGTAVRLGAQHAIFLGPTSARCGQPSPQWTSMPTPSRWRPTSKWAGPNPPRGCTSLPLVRAALAKLDAPSAVRGLKITVPGLVDHKGDVLRARFLRWTDVPSLEIRAEFPGINVAGVENDANAFALAEAYRAGSAAPEDGIYIVLDAGVGGGLLSKGQLLRACMATRGRSDTW